MKVTTLHCSVKSSVHMFIVILHYRGGTDNYREDDRL